MEREGSKKKGEDVQQTLGRSPFTESLRRREDRKVKISKRRRKGEREIHVSLVF